MAWSNLGKRAAAFDHASSVAEDARLQYGIDHDATKLLAAYQAAKKSQTMMTPSPRRRLTSERKFAIGHNPHYDKFFQVIPKS